MFVKTNISDSDVASLAAIAVQKGAGIVDPRKPWSTVTKDERRKLVQFAINRLIQDAVKELTEELDRYDRLKTSSLTEVS
jgi:hypothetical protein